MSGARRRVLETTIAIALTICAGLLLLANAKGERKHNVVDRVVLRIASPLERAVYWVVSGLGDVGNRYVWLRDVDGENRQLRADNERLRFELSEAKRAAADTTTLEALLDFRDRVPARSIGARVVSGSLSPQFRLIRVRLDRGEDDVMPGMPVVTGDGLVGRIESVIGATCEVLLVTDPRSSVDVIMPKTGGRGVLTGVGDSRHYAARIEQLDRAASIEVGDPVVTSGLGGTLPAGVAVGVVKRVATGSSSLYQEVEVAPAVDLSSLERMLILLTVPPRPPEAPASVEPSPASEAPMAGRVRGI